MKLHYVGATASADGSDAAPLTPNSTLLLPAVTIGTVGQLAVDLVIATLKAQLVGYLEDSDVLPVVGADPYNTPAAARHIAASLELYHAAAHNLYIIQQRAPAAPGRQHAFSTSMVSWIQQCGNFQRVVLLGSVPAALRHDADLMATAHVRAIALDAAQEALARQHNCTALEESLYAKEMPSVQPWPLLAAARATQLPLLALVVFAAEGDNVPDAIRLAQQAASVLEVFDDGDAESAGALNTGDLGAALGGRWAVPPSWQHLFGKSVDVTLQ